MAGAELGRSRVASQSISHLASAIQSNPCPFLERSEGPAMTNSFSDGLWKEKLRQKKMFSLCSALLFSSLLSSFKTCSFYKQATYSPHMFLQSFSASSGSSKLLPMYKRPDHSIPGQLDELVP